MAWFAAWRTVPLPGQARRGPLPSGFAAGGRHHAAAGATTVGRLANFVLMVMPHIRPDGTKHANAFDARLDGELVCTSETPLLDAARILLKTGAARPHDVLALRHAGRIVTRCRPAPAWRRDWCGASRRGRGDYSL